MGYNSIFTPRYFGFIGGNGIRFPDIFEFWELLFSIPVHFVNSPTPHRQNRVSRVLSVADLLAALKMVDFLLHLSGCCTATTAT